MIQNMRDLGGIRSADGREIRFGMLFRSAHLSQAVESDLERISTVIDLRTSEERSEKPDQTFGREYLVLPVFDSIVAGISHEERSGKQVLPDMAVLYGRLMRECSDSFRKIVLSIMNHDFSTGAVLWHCTEGKDRCGMTTALVLEALGVSREEILKDYLKTNLVNLPKAIRIRDQLAPEKGKAFADSVYQAYIADERYLQAAWEAMGYDYPRRVLEIPDDLLLAFREKVLQEAPHYAPAGI